MKGIELIEEIKNGNFKEIKKRIKKIGLTSKYIKNLLEPYNENKYAEFYIKLINNQINQYAITRFVNKFNKEQSDIFKLNLSGELEYDERNWNKNIYKYDLIIPKNIFVFIENLLLLSKENDLPTYEFIINNRNGIYCIIHKIYKFWYSSKNSNKIELGKLYNPKFSLNNEFVRISREEFKKYSENYYKILDFLEKNNIVTIDKFSRATKYSQENNSFIQGICKGYSINSSLIDLDSEKNNELAVVRINNKKAVTSLYYDYISWKELNLKNNNVILSDEEIKHYIADYELKPKRTIISQECVSLIKNFETNLIVNSIEEIYTYVENNQELIKEQGIQRDKHNLLEKIYNYLNFFELRYDEKNEFNKFSNFKSFLDRTGRLYTFFNHCPKELINHIFKLKNRKGVIESLVEIDMNSCHLNMLAMLFNKNVLKNFSIQNFVGPDLLKWFDKKLDKIPIDQLNAFKNLCSSPDYYTKISELLNQKIGVTYDEKYIKKLNMYFLYSENITNPLTSIFKLYFPFIIDFMNEIKSNYQSMSKLSYLLMRLESYFFIDKGLARVLSEGITVLPKHDCYYVAEGDAKRVREILSNIYLELTEGDIEYIPSYEKETSRIKSIFNKYVIDSKVSKRNNELKKYLTKTRECKIKENLYSNLFYQEFNDFLALNKIRNFKINKLSNNIKFKKILKRLIKNNATTDVFEKFELLINVFETNNYEEYIKKQNKYDSLFLKYIIAEYISLSIEEKTVHQPIFISRQKVSNTKILTPFEFYLQKIKDKTLKDRQIKQNNLIY